MASVKERNERYNRYIRAVTPQTSMAKSLWHSFWIGGLTCTIGQGIYALIEFGFPKLEADMVSSITLMILVSVAILFTGLGFYDKIGRVGGAGTFLPITGFANAMASAGMEFKTEGLIMGTSVKMFTVVGPVLVNGIVWSTIAGLVHYVITLIF